MELPAYKLPDPANVARSLCLRGKIFLTRAGTIILPMMILVWFLSSFPGAPAGATGPAINYSFAGMHRPPAAAGAGARSASTGR